MSDDPRRKIVEVDLSIKFHCLAIAVGALAVTLSSASAAPLNIGNGWRHSGTGAGRLIEGSYAAPPRAFDAYCSTYVDQCVSVGGVEPVALDEERWAELVAVNRSVNRHIRPNPHARLDVWTIGATSGACNEFAIEKRKELIERGWPSASLLLTVAYTMGGEAHLVVTVRTDRGDFVLDNLRSAVLPVERTNLRFVARQTTIHPRLWTSVEGVARDRTEPVEVSSELGAPLPKQSLLAGTGDGRDVA